MTPLSGCHTGTQVPAGLSVLRPPTSSSSPRSGRTPREAIRKNGFPDVFVSIPPNRDADGNASVVISAGGSCHDPSDGQRNRRRPDAGSEESATLHPMRPGSVLRMHEVQRPSGQSSTDQQGYLPSLWGHQLDRPAVHLQHLRLRRRLTRRDRLSHRASSTKPARPCPPTAR